MKMSGEMNTESDFLWYSFGTFAQNYTKYTRKMKKLLNQFNNFCYQGMLLDFKYQGIFETIWV